LKETSDNLRNVDDSDYGPGISKANQEAVIPFAFDPLDVSRPTSVIQRRVDPGTLKVFAAAIHRNYFARVAGHRLPEGDPVAAKNDLGFTSH
jgi:hypothetical protein